MTTINYINSEGNEISFSVDDLPSLLHVQMTKACNSIKNVSLETFDTSEDIVDAYEYIEFDTSEDQLLGYFLTRKWLLFEMEDEFHDIMSNYRLRVVDDPGPEFSIFLEKQEKIVVPEPEEYFPPIEE